MPKIFRVRKMAPMLPTMQQMVMTSDMSPIVPRFAMTCSLDPIRSPIIKQRPYTVPSIAVATHGNDLPFLAVFHAKMYPITRKLQ